MKKFCSEYTRYVINPKGTIYRNKHCAYCHNETHLVCHHTENLSDFKFLGRDSLQILFDVSELIEPANLRKVIHHTEAINKSHTKVESNEPLSENIKMYLTIVGLFISILSILALLLIYTTNAALRNFPGKLLICLSLSILFSQGFFLISIYLVEPEDKFTNQTNSFNDSREIFDQMCKPCYIFGSLMHFFYLGKYL